MPSAPNPIIAIIGNTTAIPENTASAETAAEDLGRELAKAGFRIMVFSSKAGFVETPVVRGYVASQAAQDKSIQVSYPLEGARPSFDEQVKSSKVFDLKPDQSPLWQVPYYLPLKDVHGVLLFGGGESTLIAGLMAMSHRKAILALADFGGKAADVWKVLAPGRDLPTYDEKSVMATPAWSKELAGQCVQILRDQLSRRAEEEKQKRLEELRNEVAMGRHAVIALVLFLLALSAVPLAWSFGFSFPVIVFLLFLSPAFAGVAGATIRLVFDRFQGSPMSKQSAITTAALGLIAGGIAGLLFITAQMTALPQDAAGATEALIRDLQTKQASRLVPFGVAVGFIAGLTLDAVFRKLLSSDVVELSAVEAKKRT